MAVRSLPDVDRLPAVARWVEMPDGSLVNLDQAEELRVEEDADGSTYRLVARMASRELVELGMFPDRVEAEIELHRVAQEVDSRGDRADPGGPHGGRDASPLD